MQHFTSTPEYHATFNVEYIAILQEIKDFPQLVDRLSLNLDCVSVLGISLELVSFFEKLKIEGGGEAVIRQKHKITIFSKLECL